MNQDRYIIRTSGFAKYFFSFLMIVFSFVIYLAIKDLFEKGFSIAPVLLSIIVGWMEYYFYNLVAGQKIEINNDRLIAKFIIPTTSPRLLPKIVKFQINLRDIDSVIIARLKYFEEHSKEFIDKGLGDVISAYRNIFLPATLKGRVLMPPIPMGWATSSTPLLYVARKDKNQNGITIITKPFSKDGFRNLIQEFKKRNIPITVEPVLGL